MTRDPEASHQPHDKEMKSVFEQSLSILKQAELVAEANSTNAVLDALRNLSLWEFSELLFALPSQDWPNLSRVLPRMTPPEIQRRLTGGSGTQLLAATVDLMRVVHYYFAEICFRSLSNVKILDYCCGFGRFIRPMYYFTNPDQIYGIDSWNGSADLWREDGLLGHVAQADHLPIGLPLPEQAFDVICGFSSFLHSSAKATAVTLTTLRRHISPAGLCIIATRPVEYWRVATAADEQLNNADEMITRHRRDGYAFRASNHPLIIDGESVFGDTSIAPDWIARHLPFWRVIRCDRGIDPMLAVIVMAPQ